MLSKNANKNQKDSTKIISDECVSSGGSFFGFVFYAPISCCQLKKRTPEYREDRMPLHVDAVQWEKEEGRVGAAVAVDGNRTFGPLGCWEGGRGKAAKPKFCAITTFFQNKYFIVRTNHSLFFLFNLSQL
jgi:hypothetical protein